MNDIRNQNAHEQHGSQLATHKDPSLRRDKSLAQNRPTTRMHGTRHGIEWVPAGDLGRRAAARVLRLGADRSVQAHTAARTALRDAGRRLAPLSSFGRRTRQGSGRSMGL